MWVFQRSTGSKTSHLVKETQSIAAFDINPIQPSASTPVVARLHKENQQATGGPTSLGVTSKGGANSQLSSGMSTSIYKKPIYLVYTIIHSESASEHDVSAKSKAGAVSSLLAPKELISQNTGTDEGPDKLSLDHTFESTNPHVLIQKTKYVNEGLETVLTQPTIGNGASDIAKQIKEELNQVKINTLDALPSMLNRDTKSLNKFAQVIESDSTKVGDKDVLSAGPASTKPVEREKNTQQATISQLFLRKIAKDAEKANGELIKKDKGKEAMSSKDAKEEETKSDSKNDYANLADFMVESSKKKKSKKFNFVNKGGDHVYLTEEQINEQKRIEESARAKVAKHEVEVKSEELFDLLDPNVVSKYYKAKLHYDKSCDKMLNKRAKSRITNCDVLTKKGLIILKVYREDGTDKVIQNFKASDLHMAEWKEVVQACPNITGKGWTIIYEQIQTRTDNLHPTKAELGIDLNKHISEQDPLDKLKNLAKKKRKNANDIHDYFRANKRLKPSVQYENYPAGTMLNEQVLDFIKVMGLIIMPGPSVPFCLLKLTREPKPTQADEDH
uniref:Uncharacterized protein n=1 Tax=Tanacetum cinerariifolium TaxID=118510 RepID=A0A6L2J106_TANCI|nr:hypothetical protein [Tanacetum cinerariifolium]